MIQTQCKVFCPYCGAEMRCYSQETVHRFDAWYICDTCGSSSPKVRDQDFRGLAERKATKAALHFYEPENRVLTLEEVLSTVPKDSNNGFLAWCEQRYWNEYDTGYEIGVDALGMCKDPFRDGVIRFGSCTGTGELSISEYNKTWRCWLRKPTNRESAEVEWN